MHRWLTVAERFRALSQRGTLAKHFARDGHAIHAIGNALSPVQLAAVASPLVQAAVDSNVLRSSARCHRENVQTLVHTKPPGTSASQVDLDPRQGFAKQASRKRATKDPQPPNTEVSPEEAASKIQPSPQQKAPTTRKPKTKQAPKPKTPKPQASAEEEAPKTPKHTLDDLELELERLMDEADRQEMDIASETEKSGLERPMDEADRQEMDIASETEKSGLPWASRSMLSEKAAELFDSFTKATASLPSNWSSPNSKSADKESPEQSSGGKAGNTGKRRSTQQRGGPDPTQRRLCFPANSMLPAGVVHLSDSD